MKKSAIIIGATLLSLLAILSSHQSHAQNSTMFVTYQNSTLGFSIEHPLDWLPWPSENQVLFRPLDTAFPSFTVKTTDLTPYLDTDTVTVKNKTIDQVVQEFKTNLSTAAGQSLGLEYHPIRQKQVNVAGNPGSKIEFIVTCCGNQTLAYTYFVFTMGNGNVYSLGYEEKPLKVPETLPIANKMLDSFRVIPIEPVIAKTVINTTESLEEPQNISTFVLMRNVPEKSGFASMKVYNFTGNMTSK
jgi:hypothetical protein